MSLSNWMTYHSAIGTGQESVTVPYWRTTAGEYPEPNFEFLKRIYFDPDVFTNVNFIKNRALGEGFHFECTATDAPNYMRSECEGYLEAWFKDVRWGDDHTERGFDELAQVIVTEEAWGGTHLLELLDPQDIDSLAPVPLTTIWKWHRDTRGQNVSIHQFPQVNSSPLTPSRYLTYKWNSVDRSPWGHGLSYPLSRPRVGLRGETLPPLISVWWQMQDDARKRLHRYATPHTIFGIPGQSATDAKSLSEAVSDPDSGESFVTNQPVTVAMDSPTARANMQPEFDMITNRIQIALNAMLGTMISSDKGFSFASSTTGYTMVDIVVWDLQRSFKRTTDYGLVVPVADQAGFPVNLLKPEMVYNIPDKVQDMKLTDILQFVQLGVFSRQEARLIAKQLANLPIPEQLPPELQQQVQQPQPMLPSQAQPRQQTIDPKMARLAQAHNNGNGQQKQTPMNGR